jgi:hypothetical protein
MPKQYPPWINAVIHFIKIVTKPAVDSLQQQIGKLRVRSRTGINIMWL